MSNDYSGDGCIANEKKNYTHLESWLNYVVKIKFRTATHKIFTINDLLKTIKLNHKIV